VWWWRASTTSSPASCWRARSRRCGRGTRGLAEEMRLALAEVYEVASFYAHFDIVMDEETAPPAITVRVCDSLSCALAGGETLLEELRSRLSDGVRVVRAPCMGGCDKAPAALMTCRVATSPASVRMPAMRRQRPAVVVEQPDLRGRRRRRRRRRECGAHWTSRCPALLRGRACDQPSRRAKATRSRCPSPAED